MSERLFPLLIIPFIFILPIVISACGDSQPEYIDPVPEGATPEDVVGIWFEVMESGDSARMAGLFDPDSSGHEQGKGLELPHASLTNIVLETTVLEDREAEVIAEFDGAVGLRPPGAAGQQAVTPVHIKSKFTLVRKPGGKWRLTGVRPVG